jgi:hypothetical protein
MYPRAAFEPIGFNLVSLAWLKQAIDAWRGLCSLGG